MLYLLENEEYTHVLSDKLPLDLDNRLYTIIHVIGGMSFHDIVTFADNATPEEMQYLYEKVVEFPSTMESLLPYAGEFNLLQHSDEYKEIKDIINFKNQNESLLQEQSQPHWDPTFNKIISPHIKEKLFNHWTKIGEPDWKSLKLFGMKNIDDYFGDSFDDILDIVYPVLKIEWEGGVDKTSFGLKKDEWRHAIVNGIYDVRFKVIPTSYTYAWETREFGGGGVEGYSCWNLTFLIDKGSWREEWPITEIFPNKTTEDVMNSYEDHQAELIEELWEWIADEAQQYFHQYCKVTVKIV